MLHLRSIRHNLCLLAAIAGSIGYVILPIIGSSTSDWCIPLLAAATICKLLFSSTINNYNSNDYNNDDKSSGNSTQKGNRATFSSHYHHHHNLQRRWQLRRILRERYYRRVDENYKWNQRMRMMNNYDDDEDEHGGGTIVHDHRNSITPSPSDHSDGSSSSSGSGFGPGIAMLPSPGIRSSSSRYQRFKNISLVKQKKQPGLRIPLLRHHLLSKNHTTILLVLSILILLPCTVYFLQLLLPLLLTQPYDGQGGVNDEDYDATTTKHHIKIANTIGKFSGSYLCLLLFPLKQYNSIFLTLGMSEVHAIRLHIVAGTGAILAGLGHGVYYIVIWLRRKGYRRYEDVFPDAECWKEMILEYGNENAAAATTTTTAAARMVRLLHNGEEEDDDEDCQSKFINLLGVLGGTSFLLLGLSSIYSLRRRNYQLFYNVHVALSILLLFVLVMHYNKMIYYIAPGLLHYMGLGLPIGVESRYRSRRYSGGVKVKKITCIPDSGGCVDIEFSLSKGTYDNNDDEFDDDDDDDECNDVAVAVKDEKSTISTMAATDASPSRDDGYVGKQHGRQSPSSSLASVGLLDMGGESSNNNYQTSTKGNISIHDTVGKYIQLHVPDLSNQSHPFTIFAPCRTPTSCRRQPSSSVDSVHILFRPFGSFTTALSNRLQALSLLQPLPTVSIRDKSTSCPTMFVNGMRCNTFDMLHKATMTHDKVVIVAGGVGIVPYISLLHAIRQQCMTIMSNIMNDKKRIEAVMNDESIIVKNHLRLINNDGEVGDEEDDYLEIGLEKVQDVEQNGHGGATYLSHSSRTYRTKCIDVHWMSRDEGLVRHVLKNYLEPYCHVDDELISIDMRNGSPPAACPISINFIVHHTSLKSSTVDPARTESICYSNDQPEPTSWAPCQDHVSTAVEGKTSSAYYAFPKSVYEGNNQSTMQNVIPTATYASIVFGGMWIVNYCYTNIQNKKVFQTRPIAVLGIAAFALAVSLISYGVILLGELLYSKLFVYSKLDDGNIGVRDHNVRSEIECGSGNSSLSQEQVVSVDDDAINGHLEAYPPANPTSSFSSCRAEDHPTVMRISHEQGRPDFGALVTDAAKGEAQPETIVDDVSSNAEWMDSGIFMCGPNAMTSSVWKAVKTVERRQSCCNRGSSIAVYQEVFEL